MKSKPSELKLETIKPELKSTIYSLCQPLSSLTQLDIERKFPKYNDYIQLVEVRRNRVLGVTTGTMDYSDLDGFYVCLENVRPELFIRRDFIRDFVLQGEIYIIHNKEGDTYQLCTNNNILTITFDRYQYNRFGLIGKKVISDKRTRQQQEEYQVEIDLKDERILQSNKWQDKLVTTLQRLAPIKRVFVRWLPCNKTDLSVSSKVTLDFFRSVIEEYEKDGFQPIPLSDCYQYNQKVERRWINKSQLHPSLEMNNFAKRLLNARGKNCNQSLVTSNNNGNVVVGANHDCQEELKQRVADMVDWLGLQLLSVDCNQEEICTKFMWPENGMTSGEKIERYDVECAQLSGIYDRCLIETCLRDLFRRDKKEKSDSIIFRALFLYNRSCLQHGSDKDLATIVMQDCFVSLPAKSGGGGGDDTGVGYGRKEAREGDGQEQEDLITVISLKT